MIRARQACIYLFVSVCIVPEKGPVETNVPNPTVSMSSASACYAWFPDALAVISVWHCAHIGTPVADWHYEPHSWPRASGRVGVSIVGRPITSLRPVKSGARQGWVDLQHYSFCHSNASHYEPICQHKRDSHSAICELGRSLNGITTQIVFGY